MFRKKIFKKIITTLFVIACVFAIYFSLDSIFSNSSVQAAWYNTGGTWTNRKSIAVDHQKVSGTTTLSNFPMLVSVIDPDLKHTDHGGNMGKTDGTDILFTSADGTTKLDHEIEKYASTTGELIAWVEIPSLSPTTTTQLYMYFGNSGASDQQNVTGVWDSDYRQVYHLDDGTTLNPNDSTSNAHNGTLAGTSGVPTATTGNIDGAASFTKANVHRVQLPSIVMPTSVTASAWIYPTDIGGNYPGIVDQQSYNGWLLSGFGGTGRPNFTINNQSINGTNTLSLNTWHYVVATHDGTNTKLYANGIEVAASTTMPSIPAGTYAGRIGAMVLSDGVNEAFGGKIDEVRVSTTARSADWIATEYNNQSSPSAFYSYGGLEKETRSSAGAKATANSSPSFSWYNTSWTNAKPILVDRTKVVATLYDFPMLVSVIDPDLRHTSHGGKVGKTDGTDILFTDADGTTKLDHEIEKYASTTGELIAWVKVTTLAHTFDTQLYMYFGNSGAADQQNATGVWDGDYRGVWHLKDGTNLDLNDSTINNRDITNSGASAISGKVGGGSDYDGTTDYSYSSGVSMTNMTLSGWVKLDALPTAGDHGVMILGMTNSTSRTGVTQWSGVMGIDQNGYALMYAYDGASKSAKDNVSVGTGNWVYITGIMNGGSNIKIYVNGVEENSTAFGTHFTSWGAGPYFATSQLTNTTTQGFYDELDGVVDEIRVSTTARSAEWIATEYKNQSSPNTFYSYGGLMSQTRQKPSGTPAPNINNRGGVKFR